MTNFLDEYLLRLAKREKRQVRVIKMMMITTFFGLIELYLLARPIGPMREIGMWAALIQMVFFTCFGTMLGLEYQSIRTSEGQAT